MGASSIVSLFRPTKRAEMRMIGSKREGVRKHTIVESRLIDRYLNSEGYKACVFCR